MTNKSLFLLGRQPALGRAELESLLGADHIELVGPQAVVTATPDNPVFFNRLGGSLKQAAVLTFLSTASWPAIEHFVKTELLDQLSLPASGKLQLGLSVYGLAVQPAQVSALGLQLKKQLRQVGQSVRLVAPQGQTYLSTAQVLGNKLTSDQGREIVFYVSGSQTIVAITTAEQNINDYTVRDRGRPKRDARVGMLPPKLAQIIINLATGPADKGTILDPFCGTGVVLQEAALMGFTPVGSDIDPRMVEYSLTNLDWMQQKYPQTENIGRNVQVGDATDLQWQATQSVTDETGETGETVSTKTVPLEIDFVASETYLGRAFVVPPTTDQLHDAVTTCSLIIKKFLRNLSPQIKPGTRLCLAVPAWQTRPGNFRHLPMLDLLEEMGYNRVSFEHSKVDELIYYRADQIVARELVIITRK